MDEESYPFEQISTYLNNKGVNLLFVGDTNHGSRAVSDKYGELAKQYQPDLLLVESPNDAETDNVTKTHSSLKPMIEDGRLKGVDVPLKEYKAIGKSLKFCLALYDSVREKLPDDPNITDDKKKLYNLIQQKEQDHYVGFHQNHSVNTTITKFLDTRLGQKQNQRIAVNISDAIQDFIKEHGRTPRVMVVYGAAHIYNDKNNPINLDELVDAELQRRGMDMTGYNLGIYSGSAAEKKQTPKFFDKLFPELPENTRITGWDGCMQVAEPEQAYQRTAHEERIYKENTERAAQIRPAYRLATVTADTTLPTIITALNDLQDANHTPDVEGKDDTPFHLPAASGGLEYVTAGEIFTEQDIKRLQRLGATTIRREFGDEAGKKQNVKQVYKAAQDYAALIEAGKMPALARHHDHWHGVTPPEPAAKEVKEAAPDAPARAQKKDEVENDKAAQIVKILFAEHEASKPERLRADFEGVDARARKHASEMLPHLQLFSGVEDVAEATAPDPKLQNRTPAMAEKKLPDR